MKKSVLLIIILFQGVLSANSNSVLKKANALFEQFRYAEAIPVYMEALKSTDKNVQREATFRIADCYRFVNDVMETRSWYSKATMLFNPEPVHFYYLGQALRSLGKYAEAHEAFKKFSELVPDEKRGEIYASYCLEVKNIPHLPDTFMIKNAGFLNSPYYDFCPATYNNGIVIVSDRIKNSETQQRRYGWTNFGFLNLFKSQPSYYLDFWTQMTKPEQLSSPFNQSFHDGPACFSADGKMVFLTRTLNNKVKKDKTNYRTNLSQIYIGSVEEGKNTTLKPFAYNNEKYSTGHPTVSADGKTMIFSSDMPGGYGGSDLYVSELQDGKWTKPQNLGPEINTFGNEVFPYWAKPDVLYFSSDGHPGFGGLDIELTEKENGKWKKPVNPGEPLNSGYDDFGMLFIPGTNDGFFSSNRPGGLGADDIYAFKNFALAAPQGVQPTEKQVVSPVSQTEKLLLNGLVKDKQRNTPISNATVFILNSSGDMVVVSKTDDKGAFTAEVEKNSLFVIKAMQDGYFDDCLNFRCSNDITGNYSLERPLLLDKYSVGQVFKIDNIYYDLNKSNIRPDAEPALNELVRIMKQYPITIELGSHTDSRSSDEYNLRLSQQRAESATRYLIENGIESNRIIPKGYGETKLLNRCSNGVACSETEHQQNRRTEFKIISSNAANSPVNNIKLDLFKQGDKIPVYMLNKDFFDNCLK